ncbi:MAG: virulence RhuM family protein, partial [Pseudonocardia sp.]|nr:virulence RhuM family protein [Pseudonocardia sp.]
EVTQATINSEFVVRQEGPRSVRREVTFYSLEMVLAVGYRVTTPRAVQFRQWATTVLREYLVKGFVLDDRRLKDPGGTDYFDELLERIRDIRASEKRFYMKVLDVFTTSVDYDKDADTARTFFATVQNKLLHAVTGHTAGELVVQRCDPAALNLGLTSWAGAHVRKRDVDIAKNYLTQEEITELNQLTTRFLDDAEDRARRRRATTMDDWVARTDNFLTFAERDVLTGPGSVSSAAMKEIAGERYAEFEERRRAEEAERAAVQEWDDLRALTAMHPDDDR